MTAPRFALLTGLTLTLLLLVPAAGSAAWQGPAAISTPGADTEGGPSIAIGAGGDAAATWWDAAGGGRTLLARKPAGQPWSAPVSLGTTTFNSKLVGVDGAGNITAAGTLDSLGGDSTGTATVATWLAGAPAPTTIALPVAGLLVRSMAVNAAGDAVIGLTSHVSGSAFGIEAAYRHGPTGAFELQPFTPATTAISYNDPTVALNDAGVAAIGFSSFASGGGQALGATRPVGGPWTVLGTLSTRTNISGPVSVGIDSAGNVLAAYTYNPAIGQYVLVASRCSNPAGCTWSESRDLSTGLPGGAISPGIAVNAAGAALLTWEGDVTPGDDSVYLRVGNTTSENSFGAAETVATGTVSEPEVVLGTDGRGAVSWQLLGGAGNTPQARVREASGAWGEIRDLAAIASSARAPDIATDGHGHIAAADVASAGGVRQIFVSSLDTVAPTVSAVALAGSPLAGDALTLSVAAADVWSPIAGAWAFGDGTTAAGVSVAHTYAAAGTYTATVTVVDGAGNAVVRQLAITVGVKRAALTTAAFKATWKQSRVSGALTVAGSVPRAGTYDVTATRGKAVVLHSSLKLPAGAFSTTLPLSPDALPGSYHVALVPPFAANQVTPASRDAVLAAPTEGVVDVTSLSGTKSGPAARTLRNARTIWASFHFASVPKGALKLTWYRKVGGKQKKLGATSKSPSAKVASYLRLGGVLHGTFTAVLSRNGTIIAQGTIKAQ